MPEQVSLEITPQLRSTLVALWALRQLIGETQLGNLVFQGALFALNSHLQQTTYCPNAPPGANVSVDFWGPNNVARLKCDHSPSHCWEPPNLQMGTCSP
jgi:hypothetical protein